MARKQPSDHIKQKFQWIDAAFALQLFRFSITPDQALLFVFVLREYL